MRTCYLHIGAPKAGSTTIQGFLGVYRDAIKAQGLDAPDFGCGEIVTGALALSGGLRTERKPQKPKTWAWRWLDKHIARTSDDLVVSREGLCNHLGDSGPNAFAKEFFRQRGVRLKLVAYVRDHVGYLNAAYAQQAKKLRTVYSFDNWLIGALGSGRYSYWKRFKPLIGDPEVEFSIKSLHRLGDGGLLPDFCGEIGLPGFDPSGFDETPFRNATPGPKAIAAGVLVGRGLKELGIDPDFDQSLHRRFRLAVEERGWDERPFFGPDDTRIARIIESFAGGDEKLAQAAWGMSWEDAAPATRRPQNVFDPTAATVAEVREVEELAREVLSTAQAPARGWRRLFTKVQPVDPFSP